jgi:hypothetical protein
LAVAVNPTQQAHPGWPLIKQPINLRAAAVTSPAAAAKQQQWQQTGKLQTHPG